MCDCIETTNKYLKENYPELNTQIYVPIALFRNDSGSPSYHKVVIETEKLDDKKRKKPIVLFASYCPFCGEKYGNP